MANVIPFIDGQGLQGQAPPFISGARAKFVQAHAYFGTLFPAGGGFNFPQLPIVLDLQSDLNSHLIWLYSWVFATTVGSDAKTPTQFSYWQGELRMRSPNVSEYVALPIISQPPFNPSPGYKGLGTPIFSFPSMFSQGASAIGANTINIQFDGLPYANTLGNGLDEPLSTNIVPIRSTGNLSRIEIVNISNVNAGSGHVWLGVLSSTF